jgi:hypothetical protein
MSSRYKKLFLSLVFLSLYAGAVVFATPPGSQYTPGETLDPACAPGDTNCSVLLSSGWGLTGNAGTDDTVNFFGTTDNQDVVIKRNNTQVARFYSDRLSVGNNAGSATHSNFIGASAGNGATSAAYSNFFGHETGNGATSAVYSNFIGQSAGYAATSAGSSNFIGQSAGYQATNAQNSNFFGSSAGYQATGAYRSNFIGDQAGLFATNAFLSTFIGLQAGYSAAGANNSNFFGISAGSFSTDANFSNFLGTDAGNSALSANNSNFFGESAGYEATYAYRSNFFGKQAGYQSTNSNNSNFIGTYAGGLATNASYSNFFGESAGYEATGASSSNFIGTSAGNGATNASESNFFGNSAGYGAINAAVSNFFGSSAGYLATDANTSNFIGTSAGNGATNASESNFFGNSAGYGATDASNSNFLGSLSGSGAISASGSNFIGSGAGQNATDAYLSNFFGIDAGYGATNASNSNLFGEKAGRTFTGNNIGSNNIIIGTNISLPNATVNAINLGGVLFGTGTYSNRIGDASITPVSGGRIGIGVVSPSYTLQVGNSGVSGIVARFQNSTGTCDINPTNTALVCSSDETLKSNITSLDSSLTSLSALRPVTYSWNSDDTNAPQVGFIAQEVEQIFPNLVFTDPTTGLKSLAYTNLIPYTVKAIQDINLSLTTLEDVEKENPFRDAIVRLLESATNGIQRIFVKEVKTEKLCIGDQSNEVCINQEQLRALIEAGQIQTVVTPPVVQEEAVIEEIEVEEGAPAPVINEVLETAQEESLVKDTTTE